MHVRRPPYFTPRISQNLVAFFAAEAKASDGIEIRDRIPKALLELVACAKHLGLVTFPQLYKHSTQISFRKSHVRGALTTGDRWIFLAVEIDSKGEGATSWESEVVRWRTKSLAMDFTVPATSDRYDPAVIAGILSSWVSPVIRPNAVKLDTYRILLLGSQ